MNTLPIDLYKVIEYGLGGDTWQEFIDRYKEKYDLLQIDGYFLPAYYEPRRENAASLR